MLNGKQMENEWKRNGKIPFLFAKGAHQTQILNNLLNLDAIPKLYLNTCKLVTEN